MAHAHQRALRRSNAAQTAAAKPSRHNHLAAAVLADSAYSQPRPKRGAAVSHPCSRFSAASNSAASGSAAAAQLRSGGSGVNHAVRRAHNQPKAA